MLPAEVTAPSENRSEYTSRISTGSSRPPSARIVTPEAPVNVVKKAQTRMVATAVPPGSHPASALNRRTSRAGVPPSASSTQASVKSGMVGSVGDDTMP